jgi:hypothetical protein
MTTDLTLPEQRTHRDELADHAEVLDRVGALMLLPGDAYATTDLVAGYYQVDRKTIEKMVERNQAEIVSDGYTVVSRAEFETDILSVSSDYPLDQYVRRVALFPRRAILRVGMLLRDSHVARAVRDALLDIEQVSSRSFDMTSLTDIAAVLAAGNAALELAQREASRAAAAQVQIEQQRPLVARATTHASGWGVKARQDFAREIIATLERDFDIRVLHEQVYEFLGRKLNLFVVGNRRDAGTATTDARRRGLADTREGTAKSGKNFATGVLTPAGQEYAHDRIYRYVTKHGTLALPKREDGAAGVGRTDGPAHALLNP